MRAALAALGCLLLVSGAAVAATTEIDGIWGVAKGKSAACAGAHVMVLHDGTYTKAMLDLGTTKGPRDLVIGTARYSFDGARLQIAPSISLAQPEPRQVFLWDPVGQILRREAPPPALTYRRCPDRPLRPLGQ